MLVAGAKQGRHAIRQERLLLPLLIGEVLSKTYSLAVDSETVWGCFC